MVAVVKCIMSRCGKKTLGGFAVLGLLLMVTGAIMLGVVFPNLLKKKIGQSLQLRNGTEASERWMNPPVSTYLAIYIFTVVNKNEVNRRGAKPKLKELGPYVYRQEKTKNITEWNEEKGTVTFTEKTTFHFEESMSKGHLSDIVNHINLVSAVFTKSFNDVILKALPGDLIETHSVEEVLFSGFDIKPYLPHQLEFVLLSMKKAGFFYGKNGSETQEFQMATGVKGMDNFGEIVLYDKKPTLSFWYDDACNQINGSDGKMFPPGLDKNRDYYVFSPDVCRSLRLQYVEDVVVEKIDALRFAVPKEVLGDPNHYRDNMCFCAEENDVCPFKGGVFLIARCQYGKPIAMSLPHFYMGEQEYVDHFEGLNPQEEKHQTYLDIEPLTGTVLRAAKRLQVNLFVEPMKDIPILKPVKKPMFFPMFWIEESGAIEPTLAEMFRNKVTKPYHVGKLSLILLIVGGIGLILLVGALAFFKFQIYNKRTKTVDLPDEKLSQHSSKSIN